MAMTENGGGSSPLPAARLQGTVVQIPLHVAAPRCSRIARSAVPASASRTRRLCFAPLSGRSHQGRAAVQSTRAALRPPDIPAGTAPSVEPRRDASVLLQRCDACGDQLPTVRAWWHGGVESSAERIVHQKGVLSGEVSNHGVQPPAARAAAHGTASAWRRRG